MSYSETVTKTDLTNILNEILPIPSLCELLYDGSFTSGTVSLNNSVADYVKLIVVFTDNDGVKFTDAVITKKASTITTMFTAMRVTGALYSKGMIVTFNNDEMTVSYNNQSTAGATPTSGTYITINQVYGVRSFETEHISDLADYIVEQGTGENWYYRKWNSGKAELWGYFSETYTAYTANAFIVGSTTLTKYPFAITDPIAQATCEKIGTGGGIITYDYRRTDYWSAIANGVNQSPAQGESRVITWSVYVIANWK